MEDRLLTGRYADFKIVGEGGITRVYSALDKITGDTVVIKKLKSDEAIARKAFENEYSFASLYRHPSLISPISLIKDGGSYFIVQPFVRGIDFKSWQGKYLPNRNEIGEIIAAILECAAFIHYSGFLYNDFKPENILLEESQNDNKGDGIKPILIDYNLISTIGESVARRGTIEYIAPEVLKGDQPGRVSDLYSIGATIYEFLTEAPPYISDDNRRLIKYITEDGRIDFSRIPPRFREGLESLLARDPEKRPAAAREAARLLGVKKEFETLYQKRIDYYLSAGPPPFAEEMADSFDKYIAGRSSKIFLIRSLNHNRMSMNYLALRYELAGYAVARITCEDPINAKIMVDDILTRLERDRSAKTLILIDDIESLHGDIANTIRIMAGSKKNIPIAAGSGRWTAPGMPVIVFDPLSNNTRKSAAIASSRAYLKRPELSSASDDFTRVTGGDPQFVYYHLKYSVLAGRLDLLSDSREYQPPAERMPMPEIDRMIADIFKSLDKDRSEILKKLAVWGDAIPMLALGELGVEEQRLIDELLQTGYLFAEKDAISFPAGEIRDFLYENCESRERQETHRYWAEAVENRLSDTEEYTELAAVHWGESDNTARGYNANLRAAAEFFKKGELSKAKKFAEKARALANHDGGSVASAAAIYAAILKGEGDYDSARRQYHDLLRRLKSGKEKAIAAKTYKELGDLYRSIKKIKKAIYYTNRALKLYGEWSDDQGIADCNNTIGLAYWVDGQYEKALESFSRAFEANTKLGNHRELAKNQSNLGIINDIIGRTQAVADHFLKARGHAVEAEDPWLEALIANNLGYFLIRQGDYKNAMVHLQDAVMISRKIGYIEGAINSLSNLGLCHLRSGDLFLAVDCDQKALETAEAFGNRYLAATAEVFLTEACILMGNYQLAHDVLKSIESGRAFAEDKSLKPQIGLLRSRLYCSLGMYDEAARSAREVSEEAVAGDARLKLEATLCLIEAGLRANTETALTALAGVVESASLLGHNDLRSAATLTLSEIYLSGGDLFSAEGWIRNLVSSSYLTREADIKARIISAEILLRKGQYDEAIEILYETESIAGVSGFVPLAFRAAVVLAEIFAACSKQSKVGETVARADSYRSRLLSSLPDIAAPDMISKTPYMIRHERVAMKVLKGEFSRA